MNHTLGLSRAGGIFCVVFTSFSVPLLLQFITCYCTRLNFAIFQVEDKNSISPLVAGLRKDIQALITEVQYCAIQENMPCTLSSLVFSYVLVH